MAKVNRKGVNLFIYETPKGEFQVRRGNKIISRHDTGKAARLKLIVMRAMPDTAASL